MNYDCLMISIGGTCHACVFVESPHVRHGVCLQASVRRTLRDNVEVTAVTVPPRTVWRRGPLIIRDSETDSRPANQTDRQFRRERRQARRAQAPTHTKKGGRAARTAKKRPNPARALSAPPCSPPPPGCQWTMSKYIQAQ